MSSVERGDWPIFSKKYNRSNSQSERVKDFCKTNCKRSTIGISWNCCCEFTAILPKVGDTGLGGGTFILFYSYQGCRRTIWG